MGRKKKKKKGLAGRRDMGCKKTAPKVIATKYPDRPGGGKTPWGMCKGSHAT